MERPTGRVVQLQPTPALLEDIYAELQLARVGCQGPSSHTDAIRKLIDAVSMLTDLVDREQKIRRGEIQELPSGGWKFTNVEEATV